MGSLWLHLQQRVGRLKEYGAIADIGEIARRYFVMNAFDGVLTILGVLVGNYVAGVRDAMVVVSTGLSTCFAMGISGLWGAYLTEAAERKRDLNDLEGYTLTKLGGTKIGRASGVAVIVVALIDGLAPLLSALMALLPFFLHLDIAISYYLSLGLALAILFALGVFLGAISKVNLIVSGLKMVGAGLVCILLGYLLD
ncbi:MAG: hypothetical protein U9R11_00240 [Chloroflexota bacterium]|nr:hypothetical protein [Chloroflexota bacterium]